MIIIAVFVLVLYLLSFFLSFFLCFFSSYDLKDPESFYQIGSYYIILIQYLCFRYVFSWTNELRNPIGTLTVNFVYKIAI